MRGCDSGQDPGRAAGRDLDVAAVADPVPIVIVSTGPLAAACIVGERISCLAARIQTRSSGQANGCRIRGRYF
jgi:hypothetical protein